jgi:hypothetical protein
MMSLHWSKMHFLLIHFVSYIMSYCFFTNYLFDRTEWVRSSRPYPISLNLRQIKNILKMDEYMDADCFNMAVRLLACHDI